MKRWLKLAAILGGIIGVAVVVAAIYLATTPGDYERRFSRIEVGMSEKEVQNLMGSDGKSPSWKYAIAEDKPQRVWVIKERGQIIEFVVVFDADSLVIMKEMYKHSQVLNYLLKDV
jgi:hypothetical protein